MRRNTRGLRRPGRLLRCMSAWEVGRLSVVSNDTSEAVSRQSIRIFARAEVRASSVW